jgi:hypothetical protein
MSYLKPPEIKTIYKRLQQSAKKRNIEFSLTISDLYYLSFPITCPILGIPLKWNIGKPKDDSYSFDRIDSSLGYNIDNIQIISFKANRCKNNLSTIELSKFGMYFRASKN